MEFGLLTIPISLLALLSFASGILIVVRQSTPQRHISECVLATSVLCVLALNAELYLLSFLPVDRPLDGLWLFHSILTLGLLSLTFYLWGGRVWRTTLHELVDSSLVLRRACGSDLVFFSSCLVMLLLVYCVYGAYNVPRAWDELAYHVPMAIQPHQDGRIAEITSDLPWTNAYPRGVELLWFWLFHWTRSDLLFHPVQLAFGVQLLIATYVLARRTGLTQWAALMCSFILGTMPVFCILTTTGYIDMAVGSGIIALLAFLAPTHDQSGHPSRDWTLAACAFGQCCLVKLPMLATIFAGLAVSEILFGRIGLRSGLGEAWSFLRARRGVFSACLVLLCCHSYFAQWLRHGNPIYPVALSLGGYQVFSGPLDAKHFHQGQTTMGNLSEMSQAERFHAAWTDIIQPLSPDSFGSLGPIFPVAVLIPFVLFALTALRERNTWHICLVALFVACLFTPSYLPRYGIAMTTVAVIGAMSILARLPGRVLPALKWGLFGLCACGVISSATMIMGDLRWIASVAGGQLPLRDRNALLHETGATGAPDFFGSPGVFQFIRGHSGPGDTLVWNVTTFHGLLWNRSYSNRVVHLPATPRDCYPGNAALLTEPTTEEMERWLSEIDHRKPRHILVYAKSACARSMQERPEHGYHVAFEDPPSRDGAMVIFQRTAQEY